MEKLEARVRCEAMGMLTLAMVALAMLAAGCSGARDPGDDIGSMRAWSAPAEGWDGPALPVVDVDPRGFRQTWGVAQSSLELADYVNELGRTAERIDGLQISGPAWSRLAGKLRDEARDKVLALTRPAKGVSQANGILVPMAAAAGFSDAYAKKYKDERDANYERHVRDIPLPELFDALVEGIRDGSLRGKLTPVGVDERKIPMRLVRKASLARGDANCKLNATERPGRKPNVFEQIGAFFWTNCYARQVMYASVKGLLIRAKYDPKVQEILTKEFDRRFPPKFREGFQKGFSETLLGAHLTLQRKVDPESRTDLFPYFSYLESYWGPASGASKLGRSGASESQDGDGGLWVNLEQLGLTLGAQTSVAADLLDGQSRQGRVLGLVTAYGSVEKMLFLLGRHTAVFANGGIVTQTQSDEELARGVPPVLAMRARGGAAYNRAAFRMEAWDLDRDIKGESSGKVYPRWMLADSSGSSVGLPAADSAKLQAESDLPTLVALIDGALSFVELANSKRTFALKFGEASKVVDPEQTGALFATELKDLPLGVLATALKTVVSEHLVGLDAEGNPLPSPQSPQMAGLTLRRSAGGAHGAEAGNVVDAAATARALIVLARLARALEPGGALEGRSDLAEVRQEIGKALPLVTLNLGRLLQDADGGFHASYDLAARRRADAGKRYLGVQTLVLQAHLDVYRLYGTDAILERALKLLGFLKSPAMWSAGSRFFRSEEGATQSQFKAADLLRLLSSCLTLRQTLPAVEAFTQAAALSYRIAEFLDEASLRQEFQTLGLLTP